MNGSIRYLFLISSSESSSEVQFDFAWSLILSFCCSCVWWWFFIDAEISSYEVMVGLVLYDGVMVISISADACGSFSAFIGCFITTSPGLICVAFSNTCMSSRRTSFLVVFEIMGKIS